MNLNPLRNLPAPLVLALTLGLHPLPLLAAEHGQDNPHQSPPAKPAFSGKVTETMNAGGYTYILLDNGQEKTWIAGPLTEVKVGDEVVVPGAFPMKNFSSKALDRTFESIMFTGKIQVGSAPTDQAPGQPHQALPEGHPDISQSTGEPGPLKIEKGSIEKVPGGYTVEELFAEDNRPREGKTIRIRGVVVKFTPQIMGKNWIHLQDGTGEKGKNDLTITTKETAKVGEKVVVKGKVSYDQNFGAGYAYKVILEKASLERE